MHDIVIRGGTVVDGTGGARRTADVAIAGDRIAEVGRVDGPARREIDADGLLVLPGWVDVHTHYDGQATWDPDLTPSSWHGVTTTVFGNCGVGFAPVRSGTEDYLINLMEGVEDIPGSVLAEGIDFAWESFPEYLSVLASTPRVMDVGAQLPHGALRFYVMGDRGADHAEVPTADELAEMHRLVVEAVRAGALGFTTSRTVKHRAADGRPTPSLSADAPELAAVADALAEAGAGLIQCNSDFERGEFELLRQMAERAGRPLSVLLLQVDHDPDRWRTTLAGIEAANRDGVRATGQVGCRPIGVMMGLDTSVHPFRGYRTYAEVENLPLSERVARLRDDAELRRRLLSERPDDSYTQWMDRALTKSFELADPLDYEPDPSCAVAARAAASGIDRWELALDLLLRDDGRALLLYPFENYTAGNLDAVAEMLAHPDTICGLGDGGAHVATICDASYPTTLLTHWTRDRRRGQQLPLELLVRKQTRSTAETFGLLDRGVVAPGYKADLNVVDHDALGVDRPRIAYDLPAGGKRLVQHSVGYRHTIVSGVEVSADGQLTGARPGVLLRGGQPQPG